MADIGTPAAKKVRDSAVSAPPTANSSSEGAVPTVDVHAANELIHSDHSYLDVRTVGEFNNGHVKDAVNVPYLFFTPQGKVKNAGFIEQVSEICGKDDLVVVGCASGARSLGASKELICSGFKHVKNMGGGYAAWVAKGFVVHKPVIAEVAAPSA